MSIKNIVSKVKNFIVELFLTIYECIRMVAWVGKNLLEGLWNIIKALLRCAVETVGYKFEKQRPWNLTQQQYKEELEYEAFVNETAKFIAKQRELEQEKVADYMEKRMKEAVREPSFEKRGLMIRAALFDFYKGRSPKDTDLDNFIQI